MKLFVIREHAKCGKAYQIKTAKLFGAEPKRTWELGTGRNRHTIDNVVTAVTDGDEIGIAFIWLFADTKKKTKARDQMCNAVERLLAKGCKVIETSSGRTCKGGAELAAMIRDASNVLASTAKNPGGRRGPAKIQVYTLDEARAISDVWMRKDLKNDKARLAELSARGFGKVTVSAWYREIKPMLASAGATQ